jgi:hypothetical protein
MVGHPFAPQVVKGALDDARDVGWPGLVERVGERGTLVVGGERREGAGPPACEQGDRRKEAGAGAGTWRLIGIGVGTPTLAGLPLSGAGSMLATGGGVLKG